MTDQPTQPIDMSPPVITEVIEAAKTFYECNDSECSCEGYHLDWRRLKAALENLEKSKVQTSQTSHPPHPTVILHDNGKRYWMERASKAEALCERLLHDPPAQMSTPLGLLPINADGMRTLVDELDRVMRYNVFLQSKLIKLTKKQNERY